MKRIKSEEIQNSIKNYVIHRNLAGVDFFTNENTSSNATEEKSSHLIDTKPNQTNKHSSLIDKNSNNSSKSNNIALNIMAMNDIALIESSINDYYSFSFNSTYVKDYLKQFEM